LNEKELKKIISELIKNSDEQNKIFLFIKNIVNKYSQNQTLKEDLIQESLIGLLKAKEKFLQNKKVNFSSYAYYWIKKQIIEFLKKESKEQYNNIQLDEEKLIYKKESDEHFINKIAIPDNIPDIEKKYIVLKFEKVMSLSEIASELNISREKVRQIKIKVKQRLKNLNKNLT